MTNGSIIWDGSTIEHDRQLLLSIVKEVVSGDDEHHRKCVEKIIKQISTKDWQRKYTHRTFVFCIYYMKGFNVIELSLAMSTQAVDALYFLMSNDPDEQSLTKKVSYVFKSVYGHEMPAMTAQAIRVLRNNVMHTGAIFGIPNSQSIRDTKHLTDFCNHYRPTNQVLSDKQVLMSLAGAFNYLMGEIVVRVLGLDWDDLLRNGNPPSKLDYFCKPSDKKTFQEIIRP